MRGRRRVQLSRAARPVLDRALFRRFRARRPPPHALPALTASFLDPSDNSQAREISIKHPVHLFTVEGADPVDKTRYGFFITASKADTALENDIAKGGCLLDDLDHTLVLFTFEDMQSHLSKDGDEYKFSYTIAEGKAGEYSLYYTKCVPNSAVSFDIQVGSVQHLAERRQGLPERRRETLAHDVHVRLLHLRRGGGGVGVGALQRQADAARQRQRIHWLMGSCSCASSR